MTDFYPIVTVEPEWALEGEDMGSKEKFWYRETGVDKRNCLFKYPRKHTGEHWAEKIAAEVATRLDILHAGVELAEFEQERGSSTESFIRRPCVLVHGNQLLGRAVLNYDPEMQFRQSAHTLDNIWATLDRTLANRKNIAGAKRRFAEYVVLDAVIGNTDRHHENWGQLFTPVLLRKPPRKPRMPGTMRRRQPEYRWSRSLAPSFDHASSLGRELGDGKRDQFLAEDHVGRYAEKGHGGIYWSADDRHAPSPLELARRAIHAYPDFFRPALAKLNELDEGSLRSIVDRVPPDWMSPSARKFALALMRYNLEQLRKLDP